jgi:hypothetical protein
MQAIFLDQTDQFLMEQDVPTDTGTPDYVMQGTTVFQQVNQTTLQILIYRELDVYVLDTSAPSASPAPGA